MKSAILFGYPNEPVFEAVRKELQTRLFSIEVQNPSVWSSSDTLRRTFDLCVSAGSESARAFESPRDFYQAAGIPSFCIEPGVLDQSKYRFGSMVFRSETPAEEVQVSKFKRGPHQRVLFLDSGKGQLPIAWLAEKQTALVFQKATEIEIRSGREEVPSKIKGLKLTITDFAEPGPIDLNGIWLVIASDGDPRLVQVVLAGVPVSLANPSDYWIRLFSPVLSSIDQSIKSPSAAIVKDWYATLGNSEWDLEHFGTGLDLIASGKPGFREPEPEIVEPEKVEPEKTETETTT